MRFPTVVLFAVAFLVAGCAHQPTPEELAKADYGSPPSDYQQTIKSYMSGILKDPYSAQYEFISGPSQGWASWLGQTAYGYRVCTNINAKNSFGGYVGQRLYFFIINRDRVVMSIYDDGDEYSIGRSGAEKMCSGMI